MKSGKDLGQFFTPPFIADFMIGLSRTKNKGVTILEPAAGKGIFLKLLEERGFTNLTAYEIDNSLANESKTQIIYESFVSAKINKKFDLVIGNPPYIRWKNLNPKLKRELNSSLLWMKYFNSLCDYLYIFILKSIELLNENGELIFITPDYWLNTKYSESLRNYMVKNGYFTDIYLFNETPIFDGVSSSFIVFRYIKGHSKKISVKISKYNSSKKLNKNVLEEIYKSTNKEKLEVFNREMFKHNERWLLVPKEVEDELNYFENRCSTKKVHSLFENDSDYPTLSDVADIANGMVSGLDKAFVIPDEFNLNGKEAESQINVLKAKNLKQYVYGKVSKYIFLQDKVKNENDLKSNYPNFFKILYPYKEQLLKRYDYNRVINYWEWVFTRSIKLFSKKSDKIFIPCKERISHKNYFRFCFVKKDIFPTQDVTAIYIKPNIKESIYYFLAFLNSEYVFKWLRYKGVTKGNIVEFSEKPLAGLPIRLIDWKNKNEVNIHNEIVELVKSYLSTGDNKLQEEINNQIKELI